MNYSLLLLGLYLMYYVYLGYTEGFGNNTYGVYSYSQENPLLKGQFNLKQNPGLSDNNYEDNYEIQQSFQIPMSSFVQETNNKKMWNTPDNGECTTADFCSSLYSYTPYEQFPVQFPNNKSTRVNFYNV
jgi:hypothetical protein